MEKVIEIFNRGPRAVRGFFEMMPSDQPVDDMFVKELADISWTRATTCSKSNVDVAQEWGKAALAGYEFLVRHGAPMVADSASENAAALRSWKLLSDPISSH